MSGAEIPTKIIEDLRDALVEAISSFKAYDVPSVCEAIGLPGGDQEEAFRSKKIFVRKRLSFFNHEKLIEVGSAFSSSFTNYYVEEALNKINELGAPQITKITRKKLAKLVDQYGLSSSDHPVDVLKVIWPLEQMKSPFVQYDNLGAFFFQHAVRNDDLTPAQMLEQLDFFNVSTHRIGVLLEAIVSGELRASEDQNSVSSAINDVIELDGYRLISTGKVSGSQVFKFTQSKNQSPADTVILDRLERFDATHVAARWAAALDSKLSDPERAITLARTLVEDVCKLILHESGSDWQETDDLPILYKRTATVLKLAPDGHTEQIFKQILSGCASVVGALGALRNKLSDAHSIGPRRARPAPRHAELAVNLAGTLSTFLIATWENMKEK